MTSEELIAGIQAAIAIESASLGLTGDAAEKFALGFLAGALFRLRAEKDEIAAQLERMQS